MGKLAKRKKGMCGPKYKGGGKVKMSKKGYMCGGKVKRK